MISVRVWETLAGHVSCRKKEVFRDAPGTLDRVSRSHRLGSTVVNDPTSKITGQLPWCTVTVKPRQSIQQAINESADHQKRTPGSGRAEGLCSPLLMSDDEFVGPANQRAVDPPDRDQIQIDTIR